MLPLLRLPDRARCTLGGTPVNKCRVAVALARLAANAAVPGAHTNDELGPTPRAMPNIPMVVVWRQGGDLVAMRLG